MGQEASPQQDSIWDIAWSWVLRQHEPQGLDPAGAADLARWLAESSAHRDTFDKAGRLWLLAGLVPPAHEIDIPGLTDVPDRKATDGGR